MPKVGGRFDLAKESFRAQGLSQLRPEDLDRDLSSVLQVFGEVHGGHSTLTESPPDAVALRERRGERCRSVVVGGRGRHGSNVPGGT
jgi:hypothetical protein